MGGNITQLRFEIIEIVIVFREDWVGFLIYFRAESNVELFPLFLLDVLAFVVDEQVTSPPRNV